MRQFLKDNYARISIWLTAGMILLRAVGVINWPWITVFIPVFALALFLVGYMIYFVIGLWVD